MKRALLALSAVLILGTCGLAPAQTVTGTILGVVSDAGGGVISQAQVVITEENTGRRNACIN